VFIPIDDHPTVNFLGMVIGPRGTTQKALESEYKVKISLRGKGTLRPGQTNLEGSFFVLLLFFVLLNFLFFN